MDHIGSEIENNGRARQLIEALVSEDEHIDCGSFLEVISRYVDLEIDCSDAGNIEPGVTSHLFDCPPCAELYASLSQIARLEAAGNLPEVDDLLADLEAGLMLPGVVATADAPQLAAEPVAWPWLSRLPRLAAAAAAVALVVAGSGWWRSAQREDQISSLLVTAGEATTIQQVAMPDGTWAQLLYDPDQGRGLLHVGGIPPELRGSAVQCWLRARDGSRAHVGDLRVLDGDDEWMVLEGEQPLGDYVAFVLTSEPEGQAIVEVPLTARR